MNSSHPPFNLVDNGISESSAPQRASLLKFFLLVFVLSVPFWVIGGLIGLEVLPGVPVSALIACTPLLAAAIVTYQEGREAGLAMLLKRAFDFRRIRAKAWYLPVVLLMPLIGIIEFGVLRVTGTPVPMPSFSVGQVLLLCLLFFPFALSEELGWSGFAIDPMKRRWGALSASILLGLVWAVYHFIPLIQVHRTPEWIAWWSLGTVAERVLIVWLYNNTGRSVFATALFHMSSNVSWQLFPVNGSFYDPRVSSLIAVAVAIIIVVAWRPRTPPHTR